MTKTCEQAGTSHQHGSKPYVVPVAGSKMPNGEPAYAVCHGMDYLNGSGEVVSPRAWAFGWLTIGDALRAIDLHCGTTHHG